MDDIYKWQSPRELSDLLGVHINSVNRAVRKKVRLKSHCIERRSSTDAERSSTGYRYLYRAIRAEAVSAEQMTRDDLLADLAGCEAHIEELEDKVERLERDLSRDDMGLIRAVRDEMEWHAISNDLSAVEGVKRMSEMISEGDDRLCEMYDQHIKEMRELRELLDKYKAQAPGRVYLAARRAVRKAKHIVWLRRCS